MLFTSFILFSSRNNFVTIVTCLVETELYFVLAGGIPSRHRATTLLELQIIVVLFFKKAGGHVHDDNSAVDDNAYN